MKKFVTEKEYTEKWAFPSEIKFEEASNDLNVLITIQRIVKESCDDNFSISIQDFLGQCLKAPCFIICIQKKVG
jgi:hypothetical protein